MSDFFHTSTPRGREDYRCEWCGEKILAGEKQVHTVGVWEGERQIYHMHAECPKLVTSEAT